MSTINNKLYGCGSNSSYVFPGIQKTNQILAPIPFSLPGNNNNNNGNSTTMNNLFSSSSSLFTTTTTTTQSSSLFTANNSNNNTNEGLSCNQIKKVICGNAFLFILFETGQLFVSGDISLNLVELGLSQNRNDLNKGCWNEINLNKLKEDDDEVLDIVCGTSHTLLLTKKNKLFGCGKNEKQQLSGLIEEIESLDGFKRIDYKKLNKECDDIIVTNIYSKYNTSVIKVIENGKEECYVSGDVDSFGLCQERVNMYYKDYKSFTKLNESFNIELIAIGSGHSFILTKEQYLYGCGSNMNGELGLGDCQNRKTFCKVENIRKIGKIIKIECGSSYTCILNRYNELYVCGSNMNGEIGLGFFEKGPVKTFVRSTISTYPIRDVSCSYGHTMVVTKHNEVYGTGSNYSGKVGVNYITYSLQAFTKCYLTNTVPINHVVCGGDFTLLYYKEFEDGREEIAFKEKLVNQITFQDINFEW
ncbi:hypothetical protein ABK040_014155 [Willaertia magna]